MNINLTLFAQAVAFAAFIWFTYRFVWPPLMGACGAPMALRVSRMRVGLVMGVKPDPVGK